MSKLNYFNFPVCLLEDWMTNIKYCLNKISHYSVYAYYATIRDEDEDEDEDQLTFERAANKFNIEFGNKETAWKTGKKLYESIPSNAPYTGIRLGTYWEFYKNEKTEFENVTLLAHLAIKSILADKAYCRITNNFLLARMAGYSRAVADPCELPDSLLPYANHYQLRKIRQELIDKWGLTIYARYTRGFFVSKKMGLDELARLVLLKSRKVRMKRNTKKENRAREKALASIYGD